MNNSTRYRWLAQPIPLSILILSILTLFTILIFNAPYTGFYFNPSTGEIFDIAESNDSTLQVGDVLIKVGEVSFEDYDRDSTQPLFTNAMKKGDLIPITIERNGIEQTVLWQMPGFHTDEFRGRLFNIWWLAYIFWVFGASIEAFIRPREIRWWLLLLSVHLTGLWIMLGSISSLHLWYGSVLFHGVTWLLLPVYLHLNWIFPKPLFTIPKNLLVLFYAISILLFFSELLQALPQGSYGLAFIITIGGSAILQIVHFVWKPEQRKQLKLLLYATLFASVPLIILGIISMFGEIPSSSPAVLLFFLFIPIIYIYSILREKLGGLEIRTNLFVSVFAFLIIICTILIILIHLVALLPVELSAPLNFIIPLLSAILSIQYFPKFQKHLEKNILGIKLDSQTLQEEYISRIIASTSLKNLLHVLEDEVFPSLLIRQYAFMQNTNGNLKALLTKNVSASELPDETAINYLLERSGNFIPDVLSDNWMRLILPLQVGDSLLGFFLLGQRDPDDLYHQSEIPILQAIANQTAIALSNSLHAEQLKQMYELGIERYEEESKRLARDLHDSVLNELSDLRRNLGEGISPDIQTSYEEVIQRLREIVNDIRSPMLMYGLAPAVKALAEEVMQKTDDTLKVIVDLQASEERMPENIEVHLFRIVQEACQNSLKHAQADCIKISGSIAPEKANLLIEDDGNGFANTITFDLENLLSNNHFGLAGMRERAYLIDAEINFQSTLDKGLKIHITWNKKQN